MKLFVHTDGGSRGNPGPAAYGFVFLDENGEVIFESGKYLGTMTNNEAEYEGLVAGLEALQGFSKLSEVDSLTFRLDSMLVVQQTLGNWKVKEPRMLPYVQKARELLGKLPLKAKIEAVPRAQNADADRVVNQTLDAHQG